MRVHWNLYKLIEGGCSQCIKGFYARHLQVDPNDELISLLDKLHTIRSTWVECLLATGGPWPGLYIGQSSVSVSMRICSKTFSGEYSSRSRATDEHSHTLLQCHAGTTATSQLPLKGFIYFRCSSLFDPIRVQLFLFHRFVLVGLSITLNRDSRVERLIVNAFEVEW